MQPEQVKRRKEREKKRNSRAQRAKLKEKTKKKTISVATELTPGKKTPKKQRTCCGKTQKNCTCRPPSGMKRKQLPSLAKRFAKTALCSVRDTTDVSA
jgi:hypothetical protein